MKVLGEKSLGPLEHVTSASQRNVFAPSSDARHCIQTCVVVFEQRVTARLSVVPSSRTAFCRCTTLIVSWS